jgi:glucokinase
MKKRIGIGIDLGGTFIKYALGREDGEILAEGKKKTSAEAPNDIILNDIASAISDMKQNAINKGLKPVVVGIGTPGAVDVDQGYLMGGTPNFKYWSNVSIAAEIFKKVKLKTFVDNDANLMALAEAKYGAGSGYANLICLTIGTGIGGGIIIDKDVYRGSHFAGAELGHMSIKHDGASCPCGGRGCLERYASATAICEYYVNLSLQAGNSVNKKDITVKQIFELFKSGDPIAEATIEKATYYLGKGIASLINIFNPDRIIIGGGVSGAGKIYIKMIEQVAFQYAMPNGTKHLKILRAKLGNKAGYLGALALAFTQLDKGL